MRLIYRGVEYEYDPTQGRRNSGDRMAQFSEPINLAYRGNRYQVDPNRPVQAVSDNRTHELIYRGNRYWVNGAGEQIEQPKTAPAISQRSLRQRIVENLSTTHRENLQRNLQHRMEVARQNGDDALLSLLEAERNQLA